MTLKKSVSNGPRAGDELVVSSTHELLHIRSHFNVQAWGATGNGSADDTSAINAASEAAAVSGGGAVYFPRPEATYLMRGSLQTFNNVLYRGDGAASIISYAGPSIFCHLDGLEEIQFQNLQIRILDPAATALVLDRVTRSNFEGVIFGGSVLPNTMNMYEAQKGVVVRRDATSNAFHNCDFNNLGTAILAVGGSTKVVSSVFGTCVRSIVCGAPTGDDGGPSVFVRSCSLNGVPGLTLTHAFASGIARTFCFNDCWFQSTAVGVEVGVPSAGPSQFGLTNCHISSAQTSVLLTNCASPTLTNVRLSVDPGSNPTDLSVNNAVAHGVAINVASSRGYELSSRTAFPRGWVVIAGGNA